MFSAITSFLFGGDKPCSEKEESVEYDMKETEDADWLLVDVADHKEADENPAEKEANPNPANIEIKADHSHANKENEKPEKDNFFTSTSYLLPRNHFQTPVHCSPQLDPIDFSESSCSLNEVNTDEIEFLLPIEYLQESPVEYLPESPVEYLPESPTLGQVCTSSVISNLFDNLVNIELHLPNETVVMKAMFPRMEKKLWPFCMRRPTKRRPNHASTYKSKPEKQEKQLVHPAELAAAFLNNQPSPMITTKNDHLEQIKELKPSQQAKEYETKKRFRRNQLNRQNKVYLYESSNKNQHRRDLWCRHSGANNNRKCC